MLALLCGWFEKLADYIFAFDSSAFVQSSLWCFYYLIQNRWHIFSQNAASVPFGNRGAPDIIRLLPTISVRGSRGGKFAAFSKKSTFSLATFSSFTMCRSLFYKSCFTWLSLQGPSLGYSCNKTTGITEAEEKFKLSCLPLNKRVSGMDIKLEDSL